MLQLAAKTVDAFLSGCKLLGDELRCGGVHAEGSGETFEDSADGQIRQEWADETDRKLSVQLDNTVDRSSELDERT